MVGPTVTSGNLPVTPKFLFLAPIIYLNLIPYSKYFPSTNKQFPFFISTYSILASLQTNLFSIMEALKMRLFFAMVVVLMAVSSVQNVAAADAPAPSPTSDAIAFVPTVFASFVALAFGLLF